MRLHFGTHRYQDHSAKPKPFRNSEKQIEKRVRAIKKAERKDKAKARREAKKTA